MPQSRFGDENWPIHIIHVYGRILKGDYDGDILGPKISKFVDQNSLFKSKIESKKNFFFENFQNIAQTVFDGGESDGGA